MSDRPTDFEQIDVEGQTVHVNESFGTSAVSRPSVATGWITEVLIDVLERGDDDSQSKYLMVSFDGGTNFKRIFTGGFLIWSVKGKITQIVVKSSSGTVPAEILINREAAP